MVEVEIGGVWVEWWRSRVAGGMRVEKDEVEARAAGRWWRWI